MVKFEENDEYSYPLLTDAASSASDPHASVKRTGTVWTAIAHIITGVIGSGVLSLAWSVAQLGWIAGPLCMVVFGIITIISSNLLCDCYRYPDPVVGHIRNRSYAEAVRSYLGKKSMWVAGIFLQETYYGYGIAYTITSAISMRAILRSNCYHKEGHDAPCEYGNTSFMFLFGAVQVVFSQIPDFHNMELLSIVAAVMSFAYTFIGLALCFAKVIGASIEQQNFLSYVYHSESGYYYINWFYTRFWFLVMWITVDYAENGQIRGDLSGVTTGTVAQKVWLSSQAIGDIAFAFTYNVILLDIQDTLKAPPPENKTMKKASTIAILITSFFFICCGCFGYAAFGDQAPGNLLTGFGFYEPYWLVDIANACIVLHLVGGYQIYSQPLFAVAERQIAKKHPDSGFMNNEYIVKLPFLPHFKLNLLRLCFRTAYVASTTGFAILFPYFNQVLGVLGALNFWPLAIYFPVEMYLAQNKVRAWTATWIVFQAFRLFCLLCTILAFIGSVEGLISSKLS